jgi:hypothetical protein
MRDPIADLATAPPGGVIRLAMGSPFSAGGSGTVNLGYIQLR